MTKPFGIPRAPTIMSAVLSAMFVVCWSSGFVGAKIGAGQASVPTLLMWRFVPASLLALAVPRLLHRVRPSAWTVACGSGVIGRHIVVGVLSQSGYLLTVYWAIDLGVRTGTTALIDGVQPLVVAALVGPALGVVVRGPQWAGLALGLGGVALVVFADAGTAADRTPWWAYAVPFAGMLFLVLATFIERRAPTTTHPLTALAIHCATSAVIFTIVALMTSQALPPSSGRFWFAVVWLVVLSTIGGYGLYWLLLDRVGPTAVNSLMFLIAPVTTLWGGWWFDEPITPLTLVGLGLGVGAIGIVTLAPSEEVQPLDRESRPGSA